MCTWFTWYQVNHVYTFVLGRTEVRAWPAWAGVGSPRAGVRPERAGLGWAGVGPGWGGVGPEWGRIVFGGSWSVPGQRFGQYRVRGRWHLWQTQYWISVVRGARR
ncbi:hypothetical protein Kisp01_30920 [Kineosporia sp. NBRC 101677]|nr:hypothetical protein Kisp01_30920 [Kineosporia sp. NBRC 101677]